MQTPGPSCIRLAPSRGGRRWAEPRPDEAIIAKTAERGKFEMFFLGDGFATGYGAASPTIGKFEPLTLLSALAMGTRRLGLAATASTTRPSPITSPAGFARSIILSGGRAAWNVVTTAYAKSAAVFAASIRRMPNAMRWPKGVGSLPHPVGQLGRRCLHRRQGGGRSSVPAASMSRTSGKYFAVDGGLNDAATAAGSSVLIQAGSSGPGQALAARIADVVFTAQNDLDEGRGVLRRPQAQVMSHGLPAGEVRWSCRASLSGGRGTNRAEEAQAIFADLNPTTSEMTTAFTCCPNGWEPTCPATRWMSCY